MLNGANEPALKPAFGAEVQRAGRAQRLRRANEALDRPLDPAEREAMIARAAEKIEELLDILLIDRSADPNTRDTPRRVARAFVEELLRGRYAEPPLLTRFDDVSASDGLVVTGPITVRSMCAHHLMPIYGHAIVGILPARGRTILGLSKYDRIVDHFARRLQSQEEMVRQIGEFIVETARPRGLVVRVSAVHMCKTHRGVGASHDSRMISVFSYGELEEGPGRQDFIAECAALESAVASRGAAPALVQT